MARRYELKKRAEKQEETRRRIVEAAIELHGIDGPAATSMSAVAERAGVQRHTLYRYFPDERSLLFACSGLHLAQNPLPDGEAWLRIEDPAERARGALGELFAYWERNEELMASVMRDAEQHELTREIVELRFAAPVQALRAALLAGRRPGKRLRAVVELALGFHTWRSLVRESGMSNAAAADLVAGMIAAAAEPAPAPA